MFKPNIVGPAIFLTLALFPANAEPAADGPEATVRAFVAAFNAQSVAALLSHVTDDVEWLNVNGSSIAVETSGREALGRSMTDYFAGCPSCRSELETFSRAGSRVTTLERAMWESKSGPKSQRSLAVYEFQGDRIRRVYYFPAEN